MIKVLSTSTQINLMNEWMKFVEAKINYNSLVNLKKATGNKREQKFVENNYLRMHYTRAEIFSWKIMKS